MNKKLVRVYKKLNVNDVKAHLLIYGDISGACANCQRIDLKIDTALCPGCQADFKYIAFRNIKFHLPKIQKLLEERPQLLIVDYEDYARNLGTVKAQEFLK